MLIPDGRTCNASPVTIGLRRPINHRGHFPYQKVLRRISWQRQQSAAFSLPGLVVVAAWLMLGNYFHIERLAYHLGGFTKTLNFQLPVRERPE